MLFFAAILLAGLPAVAGPGYFTYEGYLTDSSGHPIDTVSSPPDITMTFKIFGESSQGTCELAVETHDVTVREGDFAVRIGGPEATTSNVHAGAAYTIADVLKGAVTSGLSCSFAASESTARRLLEVSIGSAVFQRIVISAAPTAISADHVGQFKPEHLLRVTDGAGIPQPVSALSTAQHSELLSLLGGSSTSYLKPTDVVASVRDGVDWAEITSVPSTFPPTGHTHPVDQITSASGKYFTYQPDGASCQIGEVLKWNGTGWECGVDLSLTAETDPSVADFAKNAPSTDFSTPSNVLTLNPVGVAKGGTGLTSVGTANQILGTNAAGNGFEHKTLNAGTGITITHGANSVTIASSGGSESTSVANVGTAGVGVYKQMSGTEIQLKNINAATNAVIVTNDATDNEIDIGVNAELTGLSGLATNGFVKRTGAGAYAAAAIAYPDLSTTGVTNNTGLIVSNGTSFENKACAVNEVLVWQSPSGWTCSNKGLSNFTESLTTSTPNTTVPVAGLIVDGTASAIDFALVPKGVGALTAQIADGSSIGGNKRGARSVDFQRARSSNNQVASGSHSVIMGGQNNAASASYSMVGGGLENSASAYASTVPGGQLNTASGQNSFAANYGTTAPSFAQSTFGTFNAPKGSENSSSWIATDPLFVVGNGADSSNRSTALMLLKNGNVGIGTVNPSEKLDVNGKIKTTELCLGGVCRSSWPPGSSGTVTEVRTGTGLSGGPITSSGEIALANTSVVAGAYGLSNGVATFTVDAQGRLTAAANTAIGNLDASVLTTGTVDPAQMPAFSGDVSTLAGSTATSLAVTGVTAGTYKSVSVDAKGRVTAGTNPTTLAGYGITDAVINGGNTGAVVLGTTNLMDLSLITSNSTRMTIASGGNIGIGTTTPTTTLDVRGSGSFSKESASSSLSVETYSGAASNASHIFIRRARGTKASPSYPASSDVLGEINFVTATSESAVINSIATEPHGSGASGGLLDFYTTPNGTTAPIHRMRIGSNGNVGIGTNAPETKLHVQGSVKGESFRIDCPSGFVSVDASNGRQLGCLQVDLNSPSTDCLTAVLNCWDAYGGRLPSYNEIYIAFSRYAASFANKTYYQWLDGADYGGGRNCPAITHEGYPTAVGYSQTSTIDNGTRNMYHRCFIAK